jgi:CHAT domain-containing protein/predicted negative regulator of RcsB-dependent stress response
VEGALAALRKVKPDVGTIAGVRHQFVTGTVCLKAGKRKEALAAFAQAGAGAAALGWTQVGWVALRQAGEEAWLQRDVEAMRAHLEKAVEMSLAGGKKVIAGALLSSLGSHLRDAGDAARSLPYFDRAIEIHEDLGPPSELANDLQGKAQAIAQLGKYAQAIEIERRALAICLSAGHRGGEAVSRAHLGEFLHRAGTPKEAIVELDAALAIVREEGDASRTATVLLLRGAVLRRTERIDEARADYEAAIAILENGGPSDQLANAWNGLGNQLHETGSVREGLAYRRRALEYYEKTGKRTALSTALMNVGMSHFALGEVAKALEHLERSVAISEEIGDERGLATTLLNLANVRTTLGDADRAYAALEKAVGILRGLDTPLERGAALLNLAALEIGRGELAKAEARLEEVIALAVAAGDRHLEATAQQNLGDARAARGDFEGAKSAYLKAYAAGDSPLSRQLRVVSMAALAGIRWQEGQREEAFADMGRAVEAARALGQPETLLGTLQNRAILGLNLGRNDEALATAREAISLLPPLLARLGEEEEASGRSTWATLFDVGIVAAARLGRPDEVLHVIEEGRAVAFLEGLRMRDALLDVAVPPELRAEDRAAAAAETAAARRLRKAETAGPGPETEQLREDWRRARERADDVATRLQRAARSAADVVAHEPIPLERLQGCLAPDEALLLYHAGEKTALCLVVGNDGAHTVDLGDAAEVERAAREATAAGSAGIPEAAIQTLRAKLVAPLALPDAVKRVVVSPHGALAYVPFCLLVGEREVSWLPSATTLTVLQRQKAPPGKKVLALGDPDYGTKSATVLAARERSGLTQARLPATRDEAKAVGDTVLLGQDASERRFREALAKEQRWRAVHLACHGVINPDRPMLSALALSASDEDDGLLSANEVVRLRIPADLVVLSACETAKGKVYAAEGIFGLTRAFMFAGAPRVIVSLWKVDDRATQLLMEEFYVAWKKEGLPAGEALRRAQDRLRRREEETVDLEASRAARREVRVKTRPYENPRFWAGWALWGLSR